jgi:hypothetical protein
VHRLREPQIEANDRQAVVVGGPTADERLINWLLSEHRPDEGDDPHDPHECAF